MERKKEVRRHKYVGETGRSVYERGIEHTRDRRKWDKGSHMLKHIVQEHEGEDETEIQFRMRIVKTHRSSFERQIYEGIRIQNERRKHDILNSRTEYNRCALPRLVVKVGEGKDKGKDTEKREEERKEAEIERKIAELMRIRKINDTEGKGGSKTNKKIIERKGNGVERINTWEMQEEREENVSKGEREGKTWDTVRVKENMNRKRKFEHERDTHYNVRNKITKYVLVPDIKKGGKETMVGTNTNPLEDNWELATRIKEILSENYEKWERFQKEKEEIQRKKVEKERRFAVIREKKRKWEGSKEEREPVEHYKKEIKKIKHYEMWWNIWERRRGQRSTLEKSIEETEKKRRMVQWETGSKGREKETTENPENQNINGKGAESIEKYWEELEKVLENIGMDDIWREENEPREEGHESGEKEQERKKPRFEEEEEDGGESERRSGEATKEKRSVEIIEKKGTKHDKPTKESKNEMKGEEVDKECVVERKETNGVKEKGKNVEKERV